MFKLQRAEKTIKNMKPQMNADKHRFKTGKNREYEAESSLFLELKFLHFDFYPCPSAFICGSIVFSGATK